MRMMRDGTSDSNGNNNNDNDNHKNNDKNEDAGQVRGTRMRDEIDEGQG